MILTAPNFFTKIVVTLTEAERKALIKKHGKGYLQALDGEDDDDEEGDEDLQDEDMEGEEADEAEENADEEEAKEIAEQEEDDGSEDSDEEEVYNKSSMYYVCCYTWRLFWY
jgi:hypothetical protein